MAIRQHQHRIQKADGTMFHVECRTNPLTDGGKKSGTVVTFTDITEKLEAEAHIRYLTFHDPVTALYSQSFFQEELKRLDVDRNLPFSVIIGDANGLKLTNDIFGHQVGDILLKRIADAFRQSSRADDIVARVGGDEFAMLLPGTTYDCAVAIGERIQKAVSQIDYRGVRGSLAIGVAAKQGKDDDISDTLKEAEERMYINKSLGRKKRRRAIAAYHACSASTVGKKKAAFKKGLRKEEIPLLGRIIAVAEAFDFRTNPHGRMPWTAEAAIREITEASGIRFDPNVVDALVSTIDL